MTEIWDRTPRDFQNEAIPRLLMMNCPPYRPQALLLVQGTGGGKSAVVQTVGCVNCGVTVVIEPTLALSADQRSKISRARNTYGPVLAYQLDSVKKPLLVAKLQKKLNELDSESNVTIFIYTSPECLLREPWNKVFIGLIERKMLQLVCLDEIHMFVMFGLTFRKEFTLLKDSFFKHLVAQYSTDFPSHQFSDDANRTNLGFYLKVPLLLMTATFNTELLKLMENMIGIQVVPQNHLWGGRNSMARRNIQIHVDFTKQRLKHVKSVLEDTLIGNLKKKCIVYTNTASSLEPMQQDLELWLDMNPDIQGDILVINGDLKPEVKFVSAERFTEEITDPESAVNRNKFYPRVLLATAGSIGAGLDSPDVFAVVRLGFPTSIFEMAQELGRCGRGRSGMVTDHFYLLLSCEDYVYLNTRLYKPSTPVPGNISPILSLQKEKAIQQQNLIDLLKMTVLKGDCWHVQLEHLLGNPIEPPLTQVNSCVTACPKCTGEMKSYIMPVLRSGLSLFLADTFINHPSGSLTPQDLITKLNVYPDVGKVIYNRPRSIKAPAVKFVNVTVLQLIASGLIRLEITPDEQCYCRLVVNDLSPAYLNDERWTGFYLEEELGVSLGLVSVMLG